VLRRRPFNTEALIDELRETLSVAQLVGRAPSFVTALAHLVPVARSGSTALISGETGTGKELAARALHYLSDRASHPFIAVNCGALTETLLEDELFGHEKGAFTGANSSRPGLVSAAEHGTVFLDEVDGLSPRGQVALLRLLQEKTYRALGSAVERRADVRVLAATNASLESEVNGGRFRQDLYYRLCVFRIHLPPLRQRRDDVLLLAEHFLRKHVRPTGEMPRFADSAKQALLSYGWPGNVRELENAVVRAIHLSVDGVIEDADLGLPEAEAPVGAFPDVLEEFEELGPLKVMKKIAIEKFERSYLTRLMARHAGNISKAARAAGKERRELGKLLKKYNILRRPGGELTTAG
jgi:DNA-binding NtrC family response regulator